LLSMGFLAPLTVLVMIMVSNEKNTI